MINLRLPLVLTVITILVLLPMTLYAADAKIINYSSKPELIIGEVQSRGARIIVWELYDDDKTWLSVLQKIASGDESWLRVANALRAGTDAGASEMLTLAVGEALEHNPKNVFRIASEAFGVSDICGGPDVDDVRYDSYELSMKAINLRIAKVAAVKDPSLEQISKECIHYLEASKKGISDFYGIKNK
jgi:hypothetical protein